MFWLKIPTLVATNMAGKTSTTSFQSTQQSLEFHGFAASKTAANCPDDSLEQWPLAWQPSCQADIYSGDKDNVQEVG